MRVDSPGRDFSDNVFEKKIATQWEQKRNLYLYVYLWAVWVFPKRILSRSTLYEHDIKVWYKKKIKLIFDDRHTQHSLFFKGKIYLLV